MYEWGTQCSTSWIKCTQMALVVIMLNVNNIMLLAQYSGCLVDPCLVFRGSDSNYTLT